MSFGFGVGDFVTVGELCWKVYKKCKDSPGHYAELSGEVSTLFTVIKETEELLSQQGLTLKQQARLATCRQGCEVLLKDFGGLLVKYESLGSKSQKTLDRVGFAVEDMKDIRLRLMSNVSMLDAFNNASSHAKLERKLNLLIGEVRAGKREGSVVSTRTFDTTAHNDREIWEVLCRELEDISVSPGIITEKRQFIIAWFQEAIASGKLAEDAPSDVDDRSVFHCGSVDMIGTSDTGRTPKEKVSSMAKETNISERNDLTKGPSEAQPKTEETSKRITIEASSKAQPKAEGTAEHNTIDEASSNAQLIAMQTAQTISLHLERKKERSRFTATYLISKLRGTKLRGPKLPDDNKLRKVEVTGDMLREIDRRLLIAVADHDTLATSILIDEGASVQIYAGKGCTALMIATYNADITTVELLLAKGGMVNAAYHNGQTALCYAAECGHVRVAQQLLQHGADTEAGDRSNSGTALCAAVRAQHIPMMQLLLESGADIEAKSWKLRTSLIVAAIWDLPEAVRELLRNGANIEAESYGGLTALDTAAINGHSAVVRVLLENGAKNKMEEKFPTGGPIMRKAVKLLDRVELVMGIPTTT